MAVYARPSSAALGGGTRPEVWTGSSRSRPLQQLQQLQPQQQAQPTSLAISRMEACHISQAASAVWREGPGRGKDYIATSKGSGYQSLRMAQHLGPEAGAPQLGLQIPVAAMDARAVHSAAAQGVCKGALTDPAQVQQLQGTIDTGARPPAVRLSGSGLPPDGGSRGGRPAHVAVRDGTAERDHVFHMFDRNGDSIICLEEVYALMRQLEAAPHTEGAATRAGSGAAGGGGRGHGGDAEELKALLHSNTDGVITSEELLEFRSQLQMLRSLPEVGKHYQEELGVKLQSPEMVPQSSLASAPPAEVAARPASASAVLAVEPKPRPVGARAPWQADEDLAEVDTPPGAIHGLRRSPVPRERVNGVGLSTLRVPSLLGDSSAASYLEGEPDRLTSSALLSHLLSPEKVGSDKEEGEEEEEMLGTSDSSAAGWEADAPLEQLAVARRLSAKGGAGVGKARQMLLELTGRHPKDPQAWLHLAQLESKWGTPRAARTCFRRSVEAFEQRREGEELKKPDLWHVRSLHTWAALEGRAGQPDAARQLFLRSLQEARTREKSSGRSAAGEAVVGLQKWAVLEEREGNWVRARDLLQHAQTLQPSNAVVLLSRARLEARVHNFAHARTCFRLAAEADPKDPVCWQAWAVFEAEQGHLGRMRRLLQQGLEADPNNAHCLQAWAHYEALLGTPAAQQRARKLYQKCTVAHPEAVHAWQGWAVMEQEAGNLAEARRLFEACLAANPRCVPCLQAYARLEEECGNLRAALDLLTTAMQLDPDHAASYMEAAAVQDALGNADAALYLRCRATRLDKRKARLRRAAFEDRKVAGWLASPSPPLLAGPEAKGAMKPTAAGAQRSQGHSSRWRSLAGGGKTRDR